MKLTNLVLLNSEKSLAKLKTQNLPIKIAYKLNKNIHLISEQLKFIEEQRLTLIKTYGQPTNDGGYSIDKNNVEDYNKFINDFMEILQIEEEIDILPFTLDELSNVCMSSEDLDMISFLVSEN